MISASAVYLSLAVVAVALVSWILFRLALRALSRYVRNLWPH
jgi:hypothetical protein